MKMEKHLTIGNTIYGMVELDYDYELQLVSGVVDGEEMVFVHERKTNLFYEVLECEDMLLLNRLTRVSYSISEQVKHLNSLVIQGIKERVIKQTTNVHMFDKLIEYGKGC